MPLSSLSWFIFRQVVTLVFLLLLRCCPQASNFDTALAGVLDVPTTIGAEESKLSDDEPAVTANRDGFNDGRNTASL